MTTETCTATAHPRLPLRRPSFVILVLLSGISPLATDMYLPALPALSRSIHASISSSQLTLTSFLIGLAVGQIALGPLSDATGRRFFLLTGPALFIAASLACALAPSVGVLIAARLVQGFVGAAGVVCSRAVVSDYYRPDAAARRFGLLIGVGLLGPIIAPPLGTLLLHFGNWRLVFFVLAAVGVVQLAGVATGVPETLPAEHRHPGSLTATLARMTDLLRDRRFMAHVMVAALGTMGFFAYIGGSSFVLENVYGISTAMYGLVFAVDALLMATASFLFARLTPRIPVATLRSVGLAMSAGSATALLVATLFAAPNDPPLALVWVALALVAGGMGFLLPASTALSQAAGTRAKGTASALAGGISFGCGALTTPLTGLIGGASVFPMAIVMAGFLVTSLVMSRFAHP